MTNKVFPRDATGRFTTGASAVANPPKVTQVGRGMGNYSSMSTPNLNRKKTQHVIDDISYSGDYIVCICAWKGRIDDYQPHRKEAEPQGATK